MAASKQAVTNKEIFKELMVSGNFPGDPVVKTLSFHCSGHRFEP